MSDLRAAVRELTDLMVDVVESEDPGKAFGRAFGVDSPKMQRRARLHEEARTRFAEAAAAWLRTRPEQERQDAVEAATNTVARYIAPLAKTTDPRSDA